jgi:hypothetical protein
MIDDQGIRDDEIDCRKLSPLTVIPPLNRREPIMVGDCGDFRVAVPL